MPWNTTITNTGNAMLQQWASSGETLTVTRANCGNGTVSTSALAAQTALTGTIGDLIIAGKQEITAGTQYTVQIGPSATGEYTLRQVGLWARLGSGTEGLLAIYQNAEGINVPTQATEPGFLCTLFLIVAMSNQGQLVVQFSAGAYVTHADLPLSVANGGTGSSTAATARNSLGLGSIATKGANDYLPIAGGTLTGGIVRSTNLDPETAPSSAQNPAMLVWTDKNGDSMGFLRPTQNTAGRVGINLTAIRGSTYNGLTLGVDMSGTSVVELTQAPWRKALGLGTNGALPITVAQGGTGATTLASGAALIGNGTGAVQTRSITNLTEDGTVTANTNLITANTLVHYANNRLGSYLPLSGGTLTGGIVRSTNLDPETAPTSAQNPAMLTWTDKNGGSMGFLRPTQNTAGRVGINLTAIRGSTYNGLTLGVDMSGTSVVELTQAPWRKALGLGTNGALPITVAQGGTGATTAPNACANLGAVKKSGDIMTGALRTTALISYSATWAQVSLRKTADDTQGFSTYFFDVPNSRCGFTVRHPDSTYYDGYLLPTPQVETQANWYHIVTTKPGSFLYYAPGESYEPNPCVFNGMIFNSMKTFSFSVRLPRDIHEINTISVTAMKGIIGGINGAIESSTGTTDWLTKSGLTITANHVDNRTVLIQITSSAAFANATKTLTPAAYYATEFKLAFS